MSRSGPVRDEDQDAAGRGLGAVWLASGFTVFGPLPAFFLGSLAVLMRPDIDLSEARLGIAVATFFSFAAVASPFAGRFADRVGGRTALRAGLAVSLVALTGTALVTEWVHLPVTLAVAGIGHSLLQVGANLLLSDDVPLRMQGLAFGIKQSGVPGATLAAGAAVPLLGVTLGWRWTYGVAALLAAAVFVFQLSLLAPRRHVRQPRVRPAPLAKAFTSRDLTVLAVAAGLAAGASNTLAVFLVPYAVHSGVPVAQGGLLLAAASVVGLITRILLGLLADRRGPAGLAWVERLLVVGAFAFALLALAPLAQTPPLLWLAGALAYAGGWGWPGLLTFLVARQNAHAAATATGGVQTGIFVGAVAGPLLFGFAVAISDYWVGWTANAVAQVLGLILLLMVRRRRMVRFRGD